MKKSKQDLMIGLLSSIMISLSMYGSILNFGNIPSNLIFSDYAYSETPNNFIPIQEINPVSSYYTLNKTVVIVVENSLWGISAVQTAVNQYEQDLKDTGYTTIKHTNSIATVQNLRSLLQSWYINNNTVGAVLIGNLPYAQFYHPASGGFSAETFVCDLYLMDLDGSWWDINPADGIYDKHNASSGNDIYPEIYLGRIDATNRVLGGQTNSQDIITLLNKIHSYRIGGVSRSHKAITYIDDDWQLWADGTYDDWPGWLDNAYPIRTDVHTPTAHTNATDWLNNKLTQDYEFAHLCVHSGANPGTHYFGPGGSGEGTVTSTQIHNTINTPAFNFYNLFCCHGADWITTDCLATTYLYSGPRSISVLGTSKTGGMLDGSNFYDSLANNYTFGKSLQIWYQSMKSYSSSYVEWFYGLSILGDPFATIHYDCTVLTPQIYSLTHSGSPPWSSNTMPSFNWTKPSDVNGIAGYYYVIDQNPSTIPTSSNSFTKYTGVQVSSPLSDGVWYIHVVAKDNVGNIGLADHYTVKIDTSGPNLTLQSPVPSYNSSIDSLSLMWSAIDSGSGYFGTSIWMDSPGNNVYSGTLQNTILSGIPQGIHTINITSLDNLMNLNSIQFTVHVDLTDPILNLIGPTNGTTTETSVRFSWNAMDSETGYRYTKIYIDGSLKSTTYAPQMVKTISGLSPGNHVANITLYDWSGRSDSVIVNFKVKSPAIPGYSGIMVILSLAMIIGIIFLRIKKLIVN